MNRIITFLSILFISSLFPITGMAAGLDLVKITTDPKTPSPNTEATVSIQSYAVNLNTAQIVWYVNKQPVKQGIAEKSLVVQVGDFGVQTVVDITIIPTYGDILNKQIIVEAAEVDLLWEAQTYTPPFYKGKALPTFNSMVKVTAIPRRNSFTSNPKEFYYKWTYNRISGLGEALGKDSVIFRSGWQNSSVPVSVDVSVLNSGWKATGDAIIKGNSPKIVLYEEAPLLGTRFDNALGVSSTQNGNSFAIRAVPYFFSIDDYRGNVLRYTWNVNTNQVSNNYPPTNLTVTKFGTGEEKFSVSLKVQNPKRILQDGSVTSSIILSAEQ